MEYNCVQSLNKKLQETLLLTEYQLDTVLNEVSYVIYLYVYIDIYIYIYIILSLVNT